MFKLSYSYFKNACNHAIFIKRERFLIKMMVYCRIITIFATDINLMRIKLTSIKIGFTLVFDEFQNFLKVNSAIPSHIQDLWDRYHEKSKVNLVACGSIYNMMHKIFDNEDEPLYGRQDCRLNMQPFRINILKQILSDHNPKYTSEDLLCLYALTGGVAKYVAWLMDAKATTKTKMLRWVTQVGSPYLSEGTELIMSEFGKDSPII